MDLLSQTLSGIRFPAPLMGHMRASGDLTITATASEDIRFYYIVKGSAALETRHEQAFLRTGDFVMVQRCEHYALKVGEGGETISIADLVARHALPRWADQRNEGDIAQLTIGAPPFSVLILSGVFSIDSIAADFFTKYLPEVLKLEAPGLALGTWLNAAGRALSEEMASPEPGFSAVAVRALELLFLEALRTWLARTAHPPFWWRGVQDPRLHKSLEMIHANPNHHWRLEDLARISGQSRSVFAKTFADVLGETPFNYLRRWRINLAAEALKAGGKSVKEIAAAAGYSNTYPFVRAFTAQLGQTPSAYRKQFTPKS